MLSRAYFNLLWKENVFNKLFNKISGTQWSIEVIENLLQQFQRDCFCNIISIEKYSKRNGNFLKTQFFWSSSLHITFIFFFFGYHEYRNRILTMKRLLERRADHSFWLSSRLNYLIHEQSIYVCLTISLLS